MDKKRRSYVYKHTREDTCEVFYIGIGSTKNFKRAYSYNRRNEFWKNIVNKTTFIVDIIETNLSWEEACALEVKLINKYGRRDLNEGTLVNLTDGGGGTTGTILTEETKRKMSLCKSGENHPFYGKKRSKEYCNKLSRAKQGDKCYLYGVTGHEHPKARKVLQYSLQDVFIKEWDTLTRASKELNINRGNISSCCNDKLKMAGGYKWKYKNT